MTSRRQIFIGLALLLPSNFRGSWLLGAAPINSEEIYETGNHSRRSSYNVEVLD